MRNWWNNFKYNFSVKFRNFMVGRYGYPDEFYRFLSVVTIVLLVLNLLLHNKVINLLTFAVIFYQTFRLLSKNSTKRYQENQAYLKYRKKAMSFYKLTKRRWTERKDYRFRKCPACKTVLRLPNKKGSHTVKCPKCGNEFTTKI